MTSEIAQRVLDVLEWPVILEKLAELCGSEPAREYAQTISPLVRAEIGPQLDKISSLKELILTDTGPGFSGLSDISGYVTRTEKDGILSLEELGRIRLFTAAAGRLRSYLKEKKEAFPALAELYTALPDLQDLAGLLDSSLNDRNEINESAYPALKRIKKELFTARSKIEKTINSILHNAAMGTILQEKTFSVRNERYVLLIKANMKGRIKGTLHDISSSGSTLYIEPDSIAPMNDQVLMLERELSLETARILRELSQRIARYGAPLRENQSVCVYCDFLTAAARFSIKVKGSRQEIVDEPVMTLFNARHPLLQLMDPDKTVPNTIEIGTSCRGLIISGANTGGKTVLLKTIGLCALFNLHGLHVPAGPDSRMGYITQVLADIGDDQNLSQSLSTFSGQIVVITDMIRQADENSLVIIDEIIVGTNPRQGSALAQAILESLIEKGCLMVVTTHYAELKELAAIDSRFHNASVSFDIDSLRPTYRLQTGIPGVSYATEIAKNYGLDDAVINRSRELIDSRELSYEALVEQTQKYHEETEARRDQLAMLGKELKAREQELNQKEQKLQKELARLKYQQGLDFLDDLKQYRREVADRIGELQRRGLREAGVLQQELLSKERQVVEKLDDEKKQRYIDDYKPIDKSKAAPGDPVFVLPLEQEGTIESMDRGGEKATVLLGGSIRTLVPLTDLMKPLRRRQSTAPKKPPRKKQSAQETAPLHRAVPLTIQTQYNTTDLRGKRVDEALRVMEGDLDRMSRHGIESVVVIHGHGTGALKEAVRTALKTSPYVRDFRPGDHGEGGDGVTIVLMRE